MITEIIPHAYDVSGRPISRIHASKKRKVFHPTHPMGRYVSQPLTHVCSSVEDIRAFLCNCRYVSDEEQFSKRDYWLPPEEFEARKCGDCEDFALWTWRQLMSLGYSCRFVVGLSGKYGEGHAWVTFEKGGKHFLVEPLACHFKRLPRLSAIRYNPETSVSWDSGKERYFAHQRLSYNPSLPEAFSLAGEWLRFWVPFWPRFAWKCIILPFRLLPTLLKRFKTGRQHNDGMEIDG